jgi:hypothetical protein
MPLKTPLSLVAPNLVRKLPNSFAWLDHQLRSRQFLLDFEPEDFALYFFLALAADPQGLSCWRLDVMEKSMPAFRVPQLRQARENLVQKQLLAFRPWTFHDPDGIYQLLPVPLKTKQNHDLASLQTALAKIVFKPVS